jgi:hypothetical protein
MIREQITSGPDGQVGIGRSVLFYAQPTEARFAEAMRTGDPAIALAVHDADRRLVALTPALAEAVIEQAHACRWSSSPCPCADGVHDLADQLLAIGGT